MADPVPSRAAHVKHLAVDGSGSYTVCYFTSDQGSVELTICHTCHYIIAKCEHEINVWNEDGTALICELCGIDGT